MRLDRITIDPDRMNGQPCVRNMRLTVKRVVELAALYPNREEMLQEYPELEDEDILKRYYMWPLIWMTELSNSH